MAIEILKVLIYCSGKADGVSGMYTTEGDVPKLYTRGNGTIWSGYFKYDPSS